MNRYWNNLRPFEKRLLVVVGTILFIVVNLWVVVPHFSDWERVKGRMAKAQRELDLFERTLRQKSVWEAQLRALEGGGGLAVPAEDQLHHFNSAIQEQQVASGVTITSSSKIQTRTNQFFLEQSQVIGVLSKEQNLVDFLYNLGSGNSLIRVRDLTLRPDQPHQQLMANIKVIASYQKSLPKTAAKTVAALPATTPKAATTPAAESAAKPVPTPKTLPPAKPSNATLKTNASPAKSILPGSKPPGPPLKP